MWWHFCEIHWKSSCRSKLSSSMSYWSTVTTFEPLGITQTKRIFQMLTSFSISHSRFCMQSSFRLRQRRAAIRFLLRLRMSCTTSSCSRVKHCCFSICWKSFLLRDTIWSTESGSAIWSERTQMLHYCCQHVFHHLNKYVRFLLLSHGRRSVHILNAIMSTLLDTKWVKD